MQVRAAIESQDAEYMVNGRAHRWRRCRGDCWRGGGAGGGWQRSVGGNAVAVSGTLGAVAGAVGASNTFDIKATIARAGSTATNHTCVAFAELLNANASRSHHCLA